MNDRKLVLDDDELDHLDELLEKYSAREEGYDVEQLDGFLAALAIGPVSVPPSQYLPVIRGEAAGEDAPAFDSAEQMQDFLVLLARHANALAYDLVLAKGKTTHYVPVVFPDDVYETPEDAQKFLGLKWALGFVEGMRFYEEAWDAAAVDAPALERLEMLITSLMMSEEAGQQPLTLDERLDVFAELPQALRKAGAVFADARREAMRAKTVVREQKVGRNDPCPCGSGKKFKQCCGK